MKLSLNSLLLSELRAFPVTLIPDNDITDKTMLAAITANEELLNLGYTLSAEDVVNLAKCGELYSFVEMFKNALSDVKAKPMYPNFPNQVMNTDEAIFRFHQMMHYFSTYGAEILFGLHVSEGWLPNVEDTDKVKADDTLLKAKVITLIDSYDIPEYVYSKIMSKCERLTDKDQMLLDYVLPNIDARAIKNIQIPFKENIMPVFYSIANSTEISQEDKLYFLNCICKHTGDVFKCIDYCLTRNKYHFKTSQKRLFTKLLETYSNSDFEENVIISDKRSNRTELLLRYIDFNTYSRIPVFKTIVNELRSGELHSWMSKVESKLKTQDVDALKMLSKRPGIMLRMLTRLLRLGYNPTDILVYLYPHASELRTQTLVSILNAFNAKLDDLENSDQSELSRESRSEVQNVLTICTGLLRDNLHAKDASFKGKRVYIEYGDYNFARSIIETNDKSDEGGYVRSGLSYNIPDNVSRLRFFVYWNHKYRADVDLHSRLVDSCGCTYDIGWNASFKELVAVFSGDITHSDAAEYIDIDLDASKDNDIEYATTSIKLYSSEDMARGLGDLDECYVGCMAVSSLNEHVKLYNSKNCFFSHNLTTKSNILGYGFIDIKNRCITVSAKPNMDVYQSSLHIQKNLFSLDAYVNILLASQDCDIVTSREDADFVIVLDKPMSDNEISLIDNNFFMD